MDDTWMKQRSFSKKPISRFQRFSPQLIVWGSFVVTLIALIFLTQYTLKNSLQTTGIFADNKEFSLSQEEVDQLARRIDTLGNIKGEITVAFKYSTLFTADAIFEQNITAPNILYSVSAGQGISISGDPQRPTISVQQLPVQGVTAIENISGNIDLEAGENVTITTDGNKIRLSSKTFPTSTSVTLSESDVESYIFDGDNTGVLESGTLGLDTLSYIGTLPASVIVGEYTGITGVGTLSTLNVAGNAVVGGNSLYVDASSDRVGIGTTAPGASLDVNGNLVIGTTLAVGSTATFSSGIVVGGDYIADFAGNGLTIASNTLSINLASGSGLEVGAGGLSLLRTCSTSEVLSWSGTEWECAAVSGVGGTINKTGSPQSGYITFWSGANSITGESNLYYDTSLNRLGIGTTAPSSLLDVNGVITSSGGFTIAGDTITDFTGTGLSNVSGALGLSNSGVVAGTYGSSTNIPILTVDTYGRVTSVSNQNIAFDNYGNWVLSAGGNNTSVTSGSTVSYASGVGIGISNNSGAVTVYNSGVTSVAGTANQITASASTGAVTLSLPQNIHTGATVQFAGLTVGGDTITEFIGNGLTIASNTLQLNLASGSGLEFSGGQISMLRSCNSSEVLSWNGSAWACASISGVGGITKTASPSSGYLTYWSGTNSITGNSALYTDGTNIGLGTTAPGQNLSVAGTLGIREGGTGPQYYTVFQGGDQSSDVTYTLPTGDGSSGYVLTTSGTGVLSWQSVTGGSVGAGDISAVGNISSGDAFTSGTPGSSLFFTNGGYAGLGAAAARIQFIDSATDTIGLVGGNVGVGKTNPNYTLDVNGAVGIGTTAVIGSGVSLSGDYISDFTGTGLSNSAGALGLSTSGVVAGTYGSTGNVPIISVDAYGRINNISTASIGGGFQNWILNAGGNITTVNSGSTVSFTSSTGIGVSNSSGALTLYNSGVTSIVGTANQINASASIGGVTLSLPQSIHTGATVQFTGINIGGDIITEFMGSGLTVSGSSLGVKLSANSGLEFVDGGLSIVQTCNMNEVLSWNGSSWVCSSVSGVGGITKAGSPQNGYLTYWSGTNSITGTSDLYTDGTAIGIGTTSPQYKLDVNGSVRVGTTAIVGGGISLSGDYISDFTGTGLSNSSGTLGLANSGAAAGSYGSSTNIPVLTVDAFGRITSISNQNISYDNYQRFVFSAAGANTNITSGQTVSFASSAGIGLSNTAGAVTLYNSGVLSVAGTTNQITASGSTGAVTLSLPQNIHTGATVQFTGINIGEDIITEFMGSGLTVSSNTLQLNLATGSGLEFSSGQVSLLRNCNNNEVLAWNGSAWACSTISGVGGITKTGSPNSGFLTYWSGSNSITGVSALYTDGTNVGIGTTTPGYRLDVNGSVGIGTTAVIGGGISLSGDYITDLTGTGLSNAGGALGLNTTGVTAGTYGSTGNVPVVSVDAYGRINNISTVSIAGGFQNWVLNAAGSANTIISGSTVSFTASTGIGLSNSSGSLTLYNSGVTSLAGTTNQITASAATGAVTLSLPQNIHTGATVQFAQLGIGSTAGAFGLNVADTAWIRGGVGATGLFVNASGNVGIGKTNPSYALDVNGAVGIGTTAVIGSGVSLSGDYISDFTGTGLSNAGGALSLNNTGVAANTYGSATQVPVLTVDAQGRITAVTNTAITGLYNNWVLNASTGGATTINTGSTAAFNGGAGISVSNSSGTLTFVNTGVTFVTGTTNQINVSSGTGALTLSLPQSIHTGATVQFAGITIGGDTVTEFMGNGLTVSGNTLSLRLASGSGLEFSGGSVSMLRTCNSNEVLAWNGSAWACSTVSGVGGLTGTGIANYISKWTGTAAQGNSQLYDDGTNVGIGTTVPGYKLDINGSVLVGTTAVIGGGISLSGDYISDFTGTGLSNAGGALGLDTTGVTAGTYGSTGNVPVISVDAYGRINNISTVGIAGGYQNWVLNAAGSLNTINSGTTVSFTASTGIGLSNSAGSLTFYNSGVTSLAGTTNQITASASTGAVTLSLPQNIHTGATVQFNSIGLGTTTSSAYKIFAAGNIGIGMSNPSLILTNTSGNSATIKLQDANSNLRFDSPQSMEFTSTENTASSALFKAYKGSLTSRPGDMRWQIFGDGTGNEYLELTHTGVGGYVNILSGIGDIILNSASNVGVGITNTSAKFDVGGSAWLRGSTANSGGLFVDTAGYVGIGMTNPSRTLDITGTLGVSQTATFNGGISLNGDYITDLTGTGLSNAGGALGLNTTGVTAGTYGSTGNVPVVSVDAYGRINNISTVSIAGGFQNWVLNAAGSANTIISGSTVSFTASTGIGLSNSSGSLTLYNNGVTSLAGTTNQITASASTGAVTLSLPQNIHTGATVQFAQLGIGSTAGTIGLNVASTAWLRGGAGATGLYVNASGNVGIGMTNPSRTLDITGTLGVSQTATFSGGISIGGDYLTDLTGTGLSNAGGTLSLNNTGVAANTYGSATQIPVLTVDAQGRITAVTNTAITGLYNNWVLNASTGGATTINTGSTATFNAGAGMSVTNSSGTLTFVNTGVTSVAGTTNQITASAATGAVTLSLPQNIHTGATVQFTGITIGGDTITEFMGNGLTVSGNTLSLRLATGSGLEFSAGAVSLLRTCNSSEVLSWNGSAWVCSSVSGVGGITGTGNTNYISKWTGTSTQGNSQVYDNGTNVGIGTTSPSYKLDVNGSVRVGTTAVISGGISLSGDYITDLTGTGLSSAGGTLSLNNTGVTAGTYGSTLNIPVITVDAQGRITAASNQSISYDNYGRWVLSAGGSNNNITSGGTVSFTGSTGIGISNTSGAITLYNSGVTSLAGTTNQITASASTGAVTLSLPQNIHTGATVQFAQLGIGSTAGTIGLNVANTAWIRGGAGATGLYVNALGNVGIGMTNPSRTLDITGTLGVSQTATFSGGISIGGDYLTDLTGTGLSNAGGTLSLNNTGVTANTYGSATQVPVLTVDAQGRITSVTNTAITGLYNNWMLSAAGSINTISSGSTVSFTASTGIGLSNSSGSLTLYNSGVTSLAGTTNQITASAATGAVTLSLPQNIHTGATVQFGQLGIGMTAGTFGLNVANTAWLRGGTGSSGLYVNASGNVGIGTTNPTSKLEVNGDITFTTGADRTLSIADGTTSPILNIKGARNISGTGGDVQITGGLGDSTNGGKVIIDGGSGLGGLGGDIKINAGFGPSGAGSIILGNSIGNVGIGTSSPAAKLDVTGTAWLRGSTASSGGLYINSSGNVGIGTTSPGAQLDISKAAGSDPSFQLSDGDVVHGVTGLMPTNALFSVSNYSSGAGGAYLRGASDLGSISGMVLTGVIGVTDPTDSVGAIILNGSKSNGGVSTAAMGSLETVLQIETGTTKLVTVLGSGNVGIGITNPGGKLDVSGGIVALDNGDFTGGRGIRFRNTTDTSTPTGGGMYFANNNILYLQAGTANSITFRKTDGNAYAEFGYNNGKTSLNIPTGGLIRPYEADSQTALQIATYNGSTPYVNFDSTNQRVGIGTTSPAYKLDVLSSNTTGILNLTGNSITSGTGVNLTLNALSTGTGFNILSTSTALTTGRLMNLDWSPSSTATATGDLFRLNIGANGTLTGNLFALYNNDSDLFKVSTAKITSAVPHEFTAAGDVSVANDLIFTDQISNNIQSYGPLTIESGEPFESQNLTLRTFGTGSIVMELGGSNKNIYFDGSSGNVGIGITSPIAPLHVYRDSNGAPVRFQDTDGYCEINPTSTTWTCTSDQRLKKDVTNLQSTSILDKLKQVQGVSFKWKTQKDDELRYGFIAQQVEGVFPELVQTDDTGIKSVAYGGFTPYLVEALKAQDDSFSQFKLNTTGEITDIQTQLQEIDNSVVTTQEFDGLQGDVEVLKVKYEDLSDSMDEMLEKVDVNTISSLVPTVKELALRAQLADDKMASLSARITFLEDNLLASSGEAVLGVQSDGSLATSSAILSALSVTGETNLYDLGISGTINAGLLTINGFDDSLSQPAATINTIGGPLKIQSLGLESVDFMDGKVSIDPQGNMKVLGKLVADVVRTKKLEIIEPVKASEANNSKEQKSIGESKLVAGESEILIETPSVTDASKIYVTFNGEYAPATRYWISEKVKGKSFTIKLDAAVDADVDFSWLIVN